MDYKEITNEVREVSKLAAAFIRKEINNFSQSDIQAKSLNNFVTYVDKKSEEIIVEALMKLLPEAGFVAEEGTSTQKSSEFNWVIDPLDGTTNFIHRLPCFSISIALQQENRIVSGVVHELNLDECFYAYENGKAECNGKTITVSGAEALKDSLLATGFPYHDYGKLVPYLELLSDLIRNTHGIRRLGSAAVDLAYVACGRFEGFYEYGLNPWDVAAGALIVKQAGGSISDFKNGDDFLYGGEILATNTKIHNEILKVISHHFLSL